MPRALLRCSGALGLLGNSSAFKAVWSHDATSFDEEQLRPAGMAERGLTHDSNLQP